MSQDDAFKDRLIRNELILREQNTIAARGIKKYFHNDASLRSAPVAFVCECSRLTCDEHINTTIEQYQELHKRKDRFTIFRGHATPDIEKVVARHDDYEVVEKSALCRLTDRAD